MLIVWTVYASLSVATPTPLINLPFTSTGPRKHRFAPTPVTTFSDLLQIRHQYYQVFLQLVRLFRVLFLSNTDPTELRHYC
jgi:hypothetical protein